MINTLLKVYQLQQNKSTSNRHKQGRLVRQVGSQGRQAGSIDVPALNANIFCQALTELTLSPRQALHTI